MDGDVTTTTTMPSPHCAQRRARLRSTLVAVCAFIYVSSSLSSVNADSTRRTGLTAVKVGSSSTDFVSLYYALYNSSSVFTAALSPVDFKQNVPVEIKDRLDVYSLTFSDLPELLKRALLWENGYSLGDTGSIAQIHTLCGLSMAEIALSEDEYKASTCDIESCSATSWSHSPACRADQLLTVAKCASTAVDTVSSTSMWTSKTLSAQQNSTSSVPSIQIRRHNWTDPEVTQPAHVYAIHTTPQEETDVCAVSKASMSVVIPCVPYQRTDKRWCRPTQSDVMTNWLEDYAQRAQLDHTLEVGMIKTPGPVQPANGTTTTQDLNTTTAGFAKDVHGVYVSAAYKFDGSSSDFTQQFYQRHLALGNDGAVNISKMVLPEPLPKEIKDRLADASLQFDDLPALLQRALVWDSGYTLDVNSSRLTAVYVKCGLSMSGIAVSEAAMNQVSNSGGNGSCTAQSCSYRSNSSDTSSSYRSFTCTDDQLRTKTLCAVAANSSTSNSNNSSTSSRLTPLWANGGDDSATPELSVRRHAWENDGKTYIMYSIKAATAISSGSGETRSRCPDTPSMIIPCIPYSPSPAASSTTAGSAFAKGDDWCRPRPGPLVTSWLRQVAKEKQFSLLYLIPILISVALGVTGLAIYIRRKTFKRFELKTDGGGGGSSGVRRGHTMASTPDGTFTYGHLSLSQGNSCIMVDARLSALSTSSSIESFAAFSSNHVLNTLVNHPSLRLNTIPFDQIQFMSLLSDKDARTEVWLGSVRGANVTVKRLSKAKKAEYDELEEYMGEITLHASLDHPNLVKFIGVAWTTLQNLCMVTEYVDNGDLQLYLKQHCLQLAWEKAKMHIAMGIASAICCLHQQQPHVLFGDLKSKNVLLTMELDAKLINAGVNRTRSSQLKALESTSEQQTTDKTTMPYWTAPEVLQGQMHSEKADMYAFGVILTELDTHQPPYEGLKCIATGADLPPLQILEKVVAGELKPATSPFCPLEIAELIDACLDKDPQRRPSASEAMVVLAKVPIASVGVKTYSF